MSKCLNDSKGSLRIDILPGAFYDLDDVSAALRSHELDGHRDVPVPVRGHEAGEEVGGLVKVLAGLVLLGVVALQQRLAVKPEMNPRFLRWSAAFSLFGSFVLYNW